MVRLWFRVQGFGGLGGVVGAAGAGVARPFGRRGALLRFWAAKSSKLAVRGIFGAQGSVVFADSRVEGVLRAYMSAALYGAG